MTKKFRDYLAEAEGSLDQFRSLYKKSIGSDDAAVTLRELIKVINDDSLWSDQFPQLKQFVDVSPASGSKIVTAKKIPGDSADEKIETLVKAIDDDKWVDDTAKHLMRSFTLGEDPYGESFNEAMPTDEYDVEFEFTGDDGETGMGTLYYKVVNGKVDPKSLRGECEGDGNNKLDDELATAVVQPGALDHEMAMDAAQDDYEEGTNTESDELARIKELANIDEETYDGDDFYEAYGDLWFNEDDDLDEAEYQGRKVSLGKPMRGDVKKFKVYVKNPKGNVVKVNFGDPDMKIKKSNPARRRSFRARHNCDNPGPRHKARYWSCRKW